MGGVRQYFTFVMVQRESQLDLLFCFARGPFGWVLNIGYSENVSHHQIIAAKGERYMVVAWERYSDGVGGLGNLPVRRSLA